MERGTVSMRVAFVLRSAEVQPLVPAICAIACCVPTFGRACTHRSTHPPPVCQPRDLTRPTLAPLDTPHHTTPLQHSPSLALLLLLQKTTLQISSSRAAREGLVALGEDLSPGVFGGRGATTIYLLGLARYMSWPSKQQSTFSVFSERT